MLLFRAPSQTISRAPRSMAAVGRVTVGAPLMAALVMASACLNGATDPGVPAGQAVGVAVSLESQQVAVNQPSVSAITITRIKGYQGFVALSVDSVPAGVTVAFDPPGLDGAATTSILTLTAVDSALAKTTLIKIKAAGVDVNTDSVSVNLTVVKGVFSLAAATEAVSVPQGATGSIPLSITRTNGFVGPVTLLAEGLPANVTATFTPGLLPNGKTVSTLVLATLAGASPGTSTITVRAKSNGKPDQTSSVQLTVTPSTTAGFALSAVPAAISVIAGSSAQINAVAVRTGGFTGTIQVAASATPVGVTAVVTPNPAVVGGFILTVATTAAVVPGNYTLFLTGTATGQTPSVIPIALTVTAVPAVTVSVSPSPLKIAPGGYAQAAVLMTRVGGLTGDFVMTADGLPAGVTATFSPTPVMGTVTTLTLTATPNATVGVYNIVIKAAAGSDFGTATVALTVGATSIRN